VGLDELHLRERAAAAQRLRLRHDGGRAEIVRHACRAAGRGPGLPAMSTAGLVLVGLAIATGIVGVVVPVLPGALLTWAAIAVWALIVASTTAWTVFVLATLLIGGAQIVKYLVPGRRMRDAGVARRSILAGVLLAAVGFFVIPVVGFFIGFPVGVYLEELRRTGGHASASRSTREALRAMGLSIVIELTATVLAAGGWLVAVLV
jgi:uncharacterized protein YqgC (DUF456 family)